MLGELEYGFRNGTKYDKNKNHLDYFLKGANISTVFSSLQTTEIYGRLKNQLRKNGTPIPENDVWIAALSIKTASTLATFDAHFKSIESLTLLLLKETGCRART
jgi:tRNA(fMet)-specific endonuclease VapC